MMEDLWTANLDRHSPRYEAWRRILGSDEVPLCSPYSFHAELGAEKNIEVYKLDFDRLDSQQIARLIEWIGNKFGANNGEIKAELARVGYPIRAADVVVVYNMRALM